ncbi:MAG: hypothetical protein IT459_06285 [Planctomycetes bacterium]|nr:hypothetical protein [Planctomycetota bacterium]
MAIRVSFLPVIAVVAACSSTPESESFKHRLGSMHVAWVDDGSIRISRGDGEERQVIAEAPESDAAGNARVIWSDAALAADGRLLAVVRRDGRFVSPKGGCTRSELVLFELDASGTAGAPRVAWSVDACIETLSWARDGRRLLLVVRESVGPSNARAMRLHVLDRDSDAAVRRIELRPDDAIDLDGFFQTAGFERAEWTPDDRRIALRWKQLHRQWFGIADLDGSLRVVATSELAFQGGGPPVALSTKLAEDPERDAILNRDFWPLHVQSKPAAATLLARSPDRTIAWFATSRAMSVLGAISSAWRTDVVIAEDVATGETFEIEARNSYLDLWN